jgi:hypothetical protein
MSFEKYACRTEPAESLDIIINTCKNVEFIALYKEESGNILNLVAFYRKPDEPFNYVMWYPYWEVEIKHIMAIEKMMYKHHLMALLREILSDEYRVNKLSAEDKIWIMSRVLGNNNVTIDN